MDTENTRFAASPPSGAAPLRVVTVRLHHDDNVVIAQTNLEAGVILTSDIEGDTPLGVRQSIPSGHKIAVREIPGGQPVRRYGQVIGFATQTIQPGEHVHTHNLRVQDFARDYAFGADVHPITFVAHGERRAFLGYKRANRRAGTRNYIAVISTVSCSAHATREIAHHFTPERLAGYPNVDGVIALTHSS